MKPDATNDARPKPTKAVVDKLLGEGKGHTEVGRILGISRQRVYKIEAQTEPPRPRGRPRRNIAGIPFGALTPRTMRKVLGASVWKCDCKCGKTCDVAAAALQSGDVDDCGCGIAKVPVPE